MSLSIVCVTQAKPYTRDLLDTMAKMADNIGAEMVFAADGEEAMSFLAPRSPVEVHVENFMEEVLDQALAASTGDYILRIDDDERCSPEMVTWLQDRGYEAQDSWFFPRLHLWPDERHVIVTQPFFPDFQQRLTVRAKSRRPAQMHAGSPWPAYRAPVYLEHHNSLVKTKEERRALTAHYHGVLHGVKMLPEQVDVVFPEDMKSLQVALLTPELVASSERMNFWRQVGNIVPAGLEQQLQAWMKEQGLS